MVSWFIFMVWAGGAEVAYAKARGNGSGVFWSAMAGMTWPGGLGQYIARRFYEEW